VHVPARESELRALVCCQMGMRWKTRKDRNNIQPRKNDDTRAGQFSKVDGGLDREVMKWIGPMWMSSGRTPRMTLCLKSSMRGSGRCCAVPSRRRPRPSKVASIMCSKAHHRLTAGQAVGIRPSRLFPAMVYHGAGQDQEQSKHPKRVPGPRPGIRRSGQPQRRGPSHSWAPKPSELR
jgi:hypothetical protein